MTAPGELATDPGATRAHRRSSARGHRHRDRPRAARRVVPAAAAVAVAVGLTLGAGSAFWATSTPPATAVDADVLGPTSTASPELIERFGSQGRSSAERTASTPAPVAAPHGMLPSEPPPGIVALPPGLTAQDMAAGLLAADVPESGAGTFSVVAGADPGPGTGAVRTVRVEVEDGLAVDGTAFAATVMATLNDSRGWGADGSLSFARTDGEAEIRVLLASPDTVDDLCAPLRTGGEVSCGTNGRAVLNLRRWVLATTELAADKTQYRHYLVNHEVGHLLGHRHERCPGPGQQAPLMQQQSYSAAPCVPNPWPFP